jgi:hypothetical protein
MMTTMTQDEATHAEATALTVTFDDLYVLTSEDPEGEVDLFALNWNEQPGLPPYYITVAERRFAFTGATYLVRGHGAGLPRFVRGEEAEGRLVMLVEREDRLLVYVHDPAAEAEDEDKGSEE